MSANTNTTKHTPGPWSVFTTIKGTKCIQASDAASKFDVAYCAPMNEDGDNKAAREFANGRLIAAAPDLLETLKTVLLAHEYDGALTTGTARLSPAIAGVVERAIAKAEGQQ